MSTVAAMSVEQLAATNVRLVGHELRRVRCWAIVRIALRHVSVDDLHQEGVFGLIRAARAYDPGLGFRFSTLACPSIRRAILDAARAAAGKPVLTSLDAPGKDDGQGLGASVPAREGEEPVELPRQVLDAVAALSPRYRLVLHLRYYENLTLAEVGARIGGLSRERVRQIEETALSQLRRACVR